MSAKTTQHSFPALRLHASTDQTTSTSERLTDRNRRNAQRSTGPRTVEGKRRASGNSLKHGLTANPAAGVVEDPRQFEALYEALLVRLAPRDPVESALCHRIAVSLWRLQRAALADGAATDLAARSVMPHREHVQEWLQDIHDAWRHEAVRIFDPARARRQREDEREVADGVQHQVVRPGLVRLDRVREQDMMRSAAAITAMGVMLEDLADRLDEHPGFFTPEQCEQLAWLLGESARRLPQLADEIDFPDKMPGARPVDTMIGEARTRPPEAPMPASLTALIRGRCDLLRQQRQLAERELGGDAEHLARTAALLPGEGTLARLLRYERHAERGLYGALEALARYRGESVGAAMTALHVRSPDGHEVHVQQVLPWGSAHT